MTLAWCSGLKVVFKKALTPFSSRVSFLEFRWNYTVGRGNMGCPVRFSTNGTEVAAPGPGLIGGILDGADAMQYEAPFVLMSSACCRSAALSKCWSRP
jgi:hypothetical protein